MRWKYFPVERSETEKNPQDQTLLLRITLSLKSLYGLSSVCYKTTQTTGGVGVAGACPPTSKLGTFLLWPLALNMPIYRHFQINGALGETRKTSHPLLLKQNRGLKVSEFLPKLSLFGNCYKSAYLELRTMTKMSSILKQEGKPQSRLHHLQLGLFHRIQIKAHKDFLETVYVRNKIPSIK